MEEGHVVWWVHIYSVPEWWVHQGKKRSGWSDASIMPSAYRTSLWGQCYDLGLLQLVRLVQQRYGPKEWGQLFFLYIPDDMGIFQDDDARINQVQIVKSGWGSHFQTEIGHQCPDLNTIKNFWDVLEKTLCSSRLYKTSLQDFGGKLMQLWTEINVVTV